MGKAKQLLEINGATMLQRVADAAISSRLAAVYCVIGCEAAAVRASLQGRSVTYVENAAYASGLSTSLRAGLAQLPADAQAALFLLADQPGVTVDLIDALVAAATEDAIVAPIVDGRRANPVLFGKGWFHELANVTGDSGGRSVIEAHPEALILVPTDADLRDVDTPADLRNLTG
ncbi:MAG: nucleotidyltransferase family protein [Chloroflexi bacterium]|nr:nucleotidyltransferase family protein [Chloroflexota bacterium]